MQRAIITLQRIICHYGNLCSVQTQLKIHFGLKLIEPYRQRRLKQHSGCPPCFESTLRSLSLSPPLSLHLFKWKSSEGRLSLPLTSVEKHWWPSRPFTALTTLGREVRQLSWLPAKIAPEQAQWRPQHFKQQTRACVEEAWRNNPCTCVLVTIESYHLTPCRSS